LKQEEGTGDSKYETGNIDETGTGDRKQEKGSRREGTGDRIQEGGNRRLLIKVVTSNRQYSTHIRCTLHNVLQSRNPPKYIPYTDTQTHKP
jgi:hypothetical protein